MKNASPSAITILHLLTEKQFCPSVGNKNLSLNTIFALAVRNKVTPVLRHFITCPVCRKKTHPNWREKIATIQKFSVFRSLFLQQELNDVQAIFKENRIRGLLFKWHSTSQISGSDIDILVSKENFATVVSAFQAKGYSIEKTGREHKEAHLIHPHRNTHIDLHFLFAYPHFRGLTAYDISLLEKISLKCLEANSAVHFGLSYPSVEWFMIMKIAGYWYNDLLTGLGSLHALMTVCHQHKDVIDWNKFLALVESLSIKHEVLFVLALSSRLFEVELPARVTQAIPAHVKFLADIQKVEDIVVFPSMQSWNHSRYLRDSEIRFLRFLLLKLLLHQHLPWPQLVEKFHPKKLRHWGPVLIRFVTKKIPLRG